MRRLLDLAERPLMDLDAVGVAEALWLACHLDLPVGDRIRQPSGEFEQTTDGDGAQESASGRPVTDLRMAEAANNQLGTGWMEARAAGGGGLRIRLPEAPALPNARAIQRAMRPLKRHTRSRSEAVLDEERTAERYAETSVLAPVLRARRERWLELALVVDLHESMLVWHETVEELTLTLVRLGAFRDIRTWGLDCSAGRVSVTSRVRFGPRGAEKGRPPSELVDTTGRRLILVVSDCIAPAWRAGTVAAQALAPWARTGPLALVQPLPPRLWPRTGLGHGHQVRLESRFPGIANAQLLERKPADRLPRALGASTAAESVVLPILSFDPQPVAAWSELISGQGSATGWRLPTATAEAEPAEPSDSRTAEQRVRDFLRSATPTAKRLAGFLSAAPLLLPVMRVVQRALLPDSRQSHLAEVLLGGLVQRVSPSEAALAETKYVFLEGVREQLASRVLRHETLSVLEEVSDWLERQRVVRAGFRAMLGGAPGAFQEAEQPFAHLTAEVLRRLGGESAAAADRLEAALGRTTQEADLPHFDSSEAASHVEEAGDPDWHGEEVPSDDLPEEAPSGRRLYEADIVSIPEPIVKPGSRFLRRPAAGLNDLELPQGVLETLRPHLEVAGYSLHAEELEGPFDGSPLRFTAARKGLAERCLLCFDSVDGTSVLEFASPANRRLLAGLWERLSVHYEGSGVLYVFFRVRPHVALELLMEKRWPSVYGLRTRLVSLDELDQLVSIPELLQERVQDWLELGTDGSESTSTDSTTPKRPASEMLRTELSRLATVLAGVPSFGTIDGRGTLLSAAGLAAEASRIDLVGLSADVARRLVFELENASLGRLIEALASPSFDSADRKFLDSLLARYSFEDSGDPLASYTELLLEKRRLAGSDPSNTDRQRDLSVSLNQAGDLQLDRGDLSGALASYEESLWVVRRLAESEPSNASWQRALIVSQQKVGDVLLAQGNLSGALASYEDAGSVAGRLAELDQSNASWQRDLGVSQQKVGDVLLAQGDLSSALALYEKSLAMMGRLAELDPSNAGWQRDLSLSQRKLGDARFSQGGPRGALASYGESLSVARRLVESDRSNLGWQRDLSVILERIGNAQLSQGDLSGALASYEESLSIRRRLVELEPSNSVWQRDLSVSQRRVGDVLLSQGDLSGALSSYEESLSVRLRLAESDPTNAIWQRDLSVSHSKVGDVRLSQGDLSGALASYKESSSIRRLLAELDPSNASWQRDLSLSHSKVGDVLLDQGDLKSALVSYEESLSVGHRLAKSDPSNSVWQRDLSVSLGKVGDVLFDQGDLQSALAPYGESLSVGRRLAESDPSNSVWQRDLSVSQEKMGDLRFSLGDPSHALALYEESLSVRRRLAESDPSNSVWQRDLSVSLNKVGDVLFDQGDLQSALASYEQSLSVRRSLVKSDPLNAVWQRDLSSTLTRLAEVYERSGDDTAALRLAEESYEIDEGLAALDPTNATWQRDLKVSEALVARLRGGA